MKVEKSTKKMKAVICKTPYEMVVEEVSIPEVGFDEVLVKVKAAAICGSDLKSYKGIHPLVKLPKILGHEFAGTIEKTGSNVSGFSIGDRVIIEPSFPCGSCFYCQRKEYYLCNELKQIGHEINGAFADYTLAHKDFIYKCPDNVEWEEACLAQPLAIALHAVNRSGLKKGDRVLILGGGTIGLLIMQLAHKKGAVVGITEIMDEKLDLARQLGADFVLKGNDPEIYQKIVSEVGPIGTDIVVEAVGSTNTIQQSFEVVRKGGTILLVGLTGHSFEEIPLEKAVLNELNIKGTVRYTSGDYTEVLKILEDKIVNVEMLVSRRFSLDETPTVFSQLLRDSSGILKSVMTHVEY